MAEETLILLHNIPEYEINSEELSDMNLIPEEIPEGAMGEPLTFTLAVTVGGLGVLAAYLLRKSRYESFEETVEITKPDGTKEKRTIKYKKKQSEAGKTEVIKQLIESIKSLMGL